MSRPEPTDAADVAARLTRLDRPVIAVLDSGLDLFARLPKGVRVRAARSFVGLHPSEDTVGSGTACAEVLGECLAGRWRRDGAAEVHLVVAQVVDRDGVAPLDAVAEALSWVRELGVDAVAIGWGPTDPAACRGLARRLAEVGIRLVTPGWTVAELLGAAGGALRGSHAPPPHEEDPAARAA